MREAIVPVTHPRWRADVLSEVQSDGSAVLYDPRTRVAYALTASAYHVWAACDGTQPAAAIARQLAAIYDAPPDTIRRDVVALLADLGARGLVATVAQPPA